MTWLREHPAVLPVLVVAQLTLAAVILRGW